MGQRRSSARRDIVAKVAMSLAKSPLLVAPVLGAVVLVSTVLSIATISIYLALGS